MSPGESDLVETSNSSTVTSINIEVDIEKNLGAIVRDLIMREEIPEPVLFKKIHQDWEPCSWSLAEWGTLFKNEKMNMRYGQKNWNKEYPQWESECGKIDLTWREFLDWMNDQFVFLNQNGSPKDIWVYYDYKYLPDVFHMKSPDEKDFLKLIYLIENLKNKFCWDKLGFPERNGDQTTLWIGTAGAYTPGHFDTYSCNLVSQVYGKKTWLLFPPKDAPYLQPTRIPYEESSVYSRINFSSAKAMSAHLDDLKQCSALKVTLEPGDCLYVPPKWWHFVSSEELSISVNTWIELPSDHFNRMEEAVLRSIVASVVNVTYPETAIRLLNPNEMDLTDVNESDLNDLLQQTTSACLQNQKSNEPCSSHSVQVNADNTASSENHVNTECNIQSSSSSLSQPERCNTQEYEPPTKRMKKSYSISFEELLERSSALERIPSYSFESFSSELFNNSNSPCAHTSSFDTLKDTNNGNEASDESESKNVTAAYSHEENEASRPTYLDHLVNAIGHPEVLKLISNQLLKNVAMQPPSKKKNL